MAYDDGDQEKLYAYQLDSACVPALTASFKALDRTIEGSELSVLAKMIETFGNKLFLRHHAQGFEQPAFVKAYKDQEEEFCKHVLRIPVADIPADANVIRSHVIYKVKRNDNATLMLKAQIAPHGSEDS